MERRSGLTTALLMLGLLLLVLGIMKFSDFAGSLTNSAAKPTATTAAAIQSQSPSPAQATAAPAIAPLSPDSFVSAVRNVSDRVRPAVIQITTEQLVRVDRLSEPFSIPSGVGSGVIYDAAGHALTNNHVVAGAQQLLATLPDGRSFPATLVGTDPQTDLAVVKVEGTDLPVAALGDSAQLQVGDWVVAIGNALALPGGPTVTAGVVSALGRRVQQPSDAYGPGPYLFDLIQTDAPINPGNSGGPLLNLHGEVIGINTMVAGASQSGIYTQGIGFAIGINTAKPIANEIMATGKVVHAYLGVEYQPITPAIAAQLGSQQRSGALIRSVMRNSAADKAGLRPGDVIIEIDGIPIKEESALAGALRKHKPGETIPMLVVRGNSQLTIEVTLGERPSGQ